MRYYFVIRTNGAIFKVATKKPRLSLQDCYAAIGCDWVEMVPIKVAKKSYTMILNEEGKCEGKEWNSIATALYANPRDQIVDNVVITKTVGWATFTEEQAAEFAEVISRYNQVQEVAEV